MLKRTLQFVLTACLAIAMQWQCCCLWGACADHALASASPATEKPSGCCCCKDKQHSETDDQSPPTPKGPCKGCFSCKAGGGLKIEPPALPLLGADPISMPAPSLITPPPAANGPAARTFLSDQARDRATATLLRLHCALLV